MGVLAAGAGAEFIGDKSRWGAGIGSAAAVLALDYAFTVMNLDRVYAHTYAFNERSRRLMTSVGFVEEGTLRGHEIHNGAARDMCAYGILAPEFRAVHGTIFPIPK